MAHLLFSAPVRTAIASSSRRCVTGSSPALDNLPYLFAGLCLPSTSATPSSFPSSSRSISSRNPNFSKGLTKVQRKRGQMKKRLNLEKHSLLERVRQETKPDPVLGYKPGNTREKGTNDETLWTDCELYKIIISPQDAWGLREDARGNLQAVESALAKGTEEEQAVAATHGGPLRLNFNLTDEDRQLLFKDLPDVNTRDRLTLSMAFSDTGSGTSAGSMVADEINKELEGIERQEGESSDKLSRILDLRNASSKGIDVFNKRRIVEHFGGGVDVGSPETQVAIMTYRLHRLHDMLSSPTYRHDNASRRRMDLLMFKRARLLKYLRKNQPERYVALLKRVGIHRRAVEGEITLSPKHRHLYAP